MTFVIGLTGGIGSGKSAAAARFAQCGAEVIDTDALAHALTAPGGAAMSAILAAFGDTALTAGGALDRAWMRQQVFSNTAMRLQLEGILHPMIRAECDTLLQKSTAPYVILVVPLLVESGQYRARCHRIAVVDCSEAMQIARVMTRSGMDESRVRAIMAVQARRQDRLAAADDVIDNEGDIAVLQRQVDTLDRRYRELASEFVRVS